EAHEVLEGSHPGVRAEGRGTLGVEIFAAGLEEELRERLLDADGGVLAPGGSEAGGAAVHRGQLRRRLVVSGPVRGQRRRVEAYGFQMILAREHGPTVGVDRERVLHVLVRAV